MSTPPVHRPRRVALCVDRWASDATLVLWSYARRAFLRVSERVGGRREGEGLLSHALAFFHPPYLLRFHPPQQRRRGPDGVDGLDTAADRLFIIHVAHAPSRASRREHAAAADGDDAPPSTAWDRGGPLLPPLADALAAFPHTRVELEAASPAAAIVEFAAGAGIDVVLLGGRDPGVGGGAASAARRAATAVGVTRTADAVRRHAPCAVLCVRPGGATRGGLRIRSEADLSSLLGSAALAGAVPPRAPPVHAARRVMLVLDGAQGATLVAEWAAACCLFPDDEITLAPISPRGGGGTAGRRSTAPGDAPHDGDDAADPPTDPDAVVAASLAAARAALVAGGFVERARGATVVSGADRRSALVAATAADGADLVILVGAPPPRRGRLGAPASLAGHVLRHGPCPVLVLPPPRPPPRRRGRGRRADAAPRDAALSPGAGGESPCSPAAHGGGVTSEDEWRGDAARAAADEGAHSDGDARAPAITLRPPSRTSSLAATVLAGLRRHRGGSPPSASPVPSPGAFSPAASEALSPPQGVAPTTTAAPAVDAATRELAVLRWRVSERDAEVAALRARVAALEAALSECGAGAADSDDESDGVGGGEGE